MPKAPKGSAAQMPPPPDGKPPVRLPIGGEPVPAESEDDPLAQMLMRLRNGEA